MTSVTLTARVNVDHSARWELAQAFQSWASAVRLEAGLLQSNVYEDYEISGALRFEAEWTSAAHLDAHLRSPDFRILVGAMELLARDVRLTVNNISEEYGPEPVAAIRSFRDAHGSRHGHPQEPCPHENEQQGRERE